MTPARQCLNCHCNCNCRISRYNEDDRCAPCLRASPATAPPVVPDTVWKVPQIRAAAAALDFGELSRLIRSRTGLAQTDLATLTGISQNYLSQLESGKKRLSDIHKAIGFLEGLGVPPELLPVLFNGRSQEGQLDPRGQITRAAASSLEFADLITPSNIGDETLAYLADDLDLWRTEGPGHRQRSANFVRWAVTHRHASRLTAPSIRWQGPAGPLDQDRRWTDARSLLHDDTCPIVTRTAGLLVLLYAQKLSDITALTVKHVLHHDDRTSLHLGSRPIVLPAPLDDLINELVAIRRSPGSGALHEESVWLFPGHRRGLPLTEGALARRLHALGISPRGSRNTALFALAAELSAAILAKTLGIHIQSAVQWQKIAAGDWNSYAADVSQRPRA
ncbi:helix-turn-helix domain-containing protein [Streptomyces sp. NPDC055078]